MAQTTGAMGGKDCVLEMSTDGLAWTDISGFSNTVEPGEMERMAGEMNTMEGDKPIITPGKLKSTEVKVKVCYTAGAGEPAKTVRTAFLNASAFYLRWAVPDDQPGSDRFTTDAGYITKCNDPKIDAGSADPILVEFTLKTPGVTSAVIA